MMPKSPNNPLPGNSLSSESRLIADPLLLITGGVNLVIYGWALYLPILRAMTHGQGRLIWGGDGEFVPVVLSYLLVTLASLYIRFRVGRRAYATPPPRRAAGRWLLCASVLDLLMYALIGVGNVDFLTTQSTARWATLMLLAALWLFLLLSTLVIYRRLRCQTESGPRVAAQLRRWPLTPVLIALLLVMVQRLPSNTAPTGHVFSKYSLAHAVLIDHGSYYQVELTYAAGVTPRALGREYGQLIKRNVPNYEALVDAYLCDCLTPAEYRLCLHRAAVIRPQLDTAYQEEIAGLAAELCRGTADTLGDDKLSVNEIFLVNLLGDTLRTTQCSALSVFGAHSATGHTLTARLLDWPGLTELPQLQAVTTIRYADGRQLCLIGYLGFLGMLTGYNQAGLFAGVLDAPVGTPYPDPPTGMRSYMMDLRHALEAESTLAPAAAYLSRRDHRYAFNYAVIFSDATESQVLENDQLSPGPLARTLRNSQSPLNRGVAWGLPQALGCVNAFVLRGNHDNLMTGYLNYARWANIRALLSNAGKPVGVEELKRFACYRAPLRLLPVRYGDLYRDTTQMIVIFQPATRELDIAFRPRDNSLAAPPVFTHFAPDTLTLSR